MVYKVISHGINHPSHNYEDTIKSGAICPECGEFNTDMLKCNFQHTFKKGLIYKWEYVTGRFLCKTCNCIFESKRICVDKERSRRTKEDGSTDRTVLSDLIIAISSMLAIAIGISMIIRGFDDGNNFLGMCGFIITLVGIIRFLCLED